MFPEWHHAVPESAYFKVPETLKTFRMYPIFRFVYVLHWLLTTRPRRRVHIGPFVWMFRRLLGTPVCWPKLYMIVPKLLEQLRRHQREALAASAVGILWLLWSCCHYIRTRAMDTPIECIKWRPDRSKRTRQDEFRERVNSKFRLTLGESGHTQWLTQSQWQSLSQCDMPGICCRKCWREVGWSGVPVFVLGYANC